jgi:3-oxoacyl-[acyl-carrier protein] reductase
MILQPLSGQFRNRGLFQEVKEMADSMIHERVALIAGGVRGIGRATALSLARQGWAIAACYKTNHGEAGTLQSELQNIGVPALCLCYDISNPVMAENMVREVETKFGRIDALINCVGAYHRISLAEESIKGWHAMFDNNLHPVFYLSRTVAPGMIRRGWGRIVNFSMVNADQLIAQPFVTAHYIAKMGILVLTRSLAKMLAPHGITVNAVSPGFIDTGSVPQEELARSFKTIPAGYMGSPEDAVSAICYFLSEEARYVNGTNIHVSGGWGI